MFNPNPTLQSVPLHEGHTCWVIDDALTQPEQLRQFARDQRSAFAPAPHNAYPGVERLMPPEFSDRLAEFFAQHLRRRLGGRRTLQMYSRLAMVTKQPHELLPRQWLCHRDNQGLPADQCIAASVLYLFEDPALGGTAFYRPRKSAQETAQLVHDCGQMDAATFSARYGIAPGYMLEGNDWFEKTGSVPARYNRLIFYDGSLFHTGELATPSRYVNDPDAGRLTVNGFFTCSRAAG